MNKQIRADLYPCEARVKVHRRQIMRKMEADSLAELVRMADRLGIYSEEWRVATNVTGSATKVAVLRRWRTHVATNALCPSDSQRNSVSPDARRYWADALSVGIATCT